jgi:hypothetical protein
MVGNAQERGESTLPISLENNWLLDSALDHLTIGKANCAQKIVLGNSDVATDTLNLINTAIHGIRDAGTLHFIPNGLLVRSQLYIDLALKHHNEAL